MSEGMTSTSTNVWAQAIDALVKATENGFVPVVDAEEEEEECDHKGHYRITGGAYIAIRYCLNCGKSWRMFTKGDYGDYPVAEWEPIKERMEVEEIVVGNYDEAQIYTEDDGLEDD